MKTNATEGELNLALARLNSEYDNNISFKRFDVAGNRVNFTLTVKDSRGTGSRKSHTGRRIAAACWHAHGRFFEILTGIDREIFVMTTGSNGLMRIDGELNKDNNWQDRNIGSRMMPFYYSEACDC